MVLGKLRVVVCGRTGQARITFGELHQKVREATGAIDEGCDVQLMLGNTILHHGRAVVLKDMARCDGMELTYIFQPVEPPLVSRQDNRPLDRSSSPA